MKTNAFVHVYSDVEAQATGSSRPYNDFFRRATHNGLVHSAMYAVARCLFLRHTPVLFLNDNSTIASFFLPARRYASAGICCGISVCLSVTRVLCIKTAECFVEILLPCT